MLTPRAFSCGTRMRVNIIGGVQRVPVAVRRLPWRLPGGCLAAARSMRPSGVPQAAVIFEAAGLPKLNAQSPSER